MNCIHARNLFPAYWDDETTQAEREWLEGHFTSCPGCRLEYERYARTLELLASMPRIEAAPDLAERALARARRAETAPDRLPATTNRWVPVTAAAAAVLLIGLTVSAPWMMNSRSQHMAARTPAAGLVSEPVLVARTSDTHTLAPRPAAVAHVTAADSLFDHSEDVEFVLDPVTLYRGRASVSRSSGHEQGERAVITF